jgi:hypothetical protein
MKKIATCTLLLLMALSAYANTYTFFNKADATSGTAFKTKTLHDIVPIFFGKDHWIKVGNKHNGDTGWIKQSDLHNLTQVGNQYHQRFHQTHKSEQGTSDNTFEYTGTNPISQKQAEHMLKRMQQRQQRWHQHMARMTNHMNHLFADMEADMWALFPDDINQQNTAKNDTTAKKKPQAKTK